MSAGKRDANERRSRRAILDQMHVVADQLDVGTGETQGRPSRWTTLRATRVLRWTEGATR